MSKKVANSKAPPESRPSREKKKKKKEKGKKEEVKKEVSAQPFPPEETKDVMDHDASSIASPTPAAGTSTSGSGTDSSGSSVASTNSSSTGSTVSRLIAEANLFRSRNKLDDAISTFDEVLRRDPTNTHALNAKGVCFKQLGDNAKAMECYNQVLKLDPENGTAYSNRGDIYKDTGLFAEAIKEYRLSIKHGSKETPAKENIAIVLTDFGTRLKLAGNLTDAIQKYTEASTYNPKYAPAYFNMGVVCSEAENYVEALRYYNLAVRCNPNYVEALCNIGVIYKNAGKLDMAINFYQKALKANPNFTVANNNLAIALTDMGTKVKTEGDIKAGIEYYKKALVYNTKYPAAWYNLGVADAEMGRHDEAIVCYEIAVTFDPDCAEAYNNLGVIYKDRGNLEKSIFYYKKALEANPRFAQTLNNLGVIYTMLGKLDEAYAYCKKAIQANKNYAEAYNNLGVLYRDEGKIRLAIESYNQCLAIDPNSRNAGQNRLLAMNSLLPGRDETDISLIDRIWKEHEAWGIRFTSLFKPYTHWDNKLTTDRPLRIGYLSADFFTHSVSYFIEVPLAHANPKRVFNVCYSNVVRKDKKTEHLQKLCHLWRSVYGLNHQQVGEMIRRDKIDILIELTGHTAGNRLDVMAVKPSPLAVTWIGYPNTTGLPTIDYRFTDAVVDPPDTKQKYSEGLVRLPGPFLCYTPPTDAPEVSETPALSNGFVTFGSFNNLAKVNQKVLQVWCAILNRVRDSRMLIKCKPFASDTVRTKILQRFEKLGVPAKRVDLTPLLPTTKEHLSMYSMIDISLDTFPYAGTTTTCEALFMGVPVITLAKHHNHAHSVGATLLSRIKGLQEYVTWTETDYVEKAVALATNLPRLSALRRGVRAAMLKSPVCDGKTFTRGLEDTYVDLWAKHVESHDKKMSLSSTSSTLSSTSTITSPAGIDSDAMDSDTTTDSSNLALLHGLD